MDHRSAIYAEGWTWRSRLESRLCDKSGSLGIDGRATRRVFVQVTHQMRVFAARELLEWKAR
jgi:hypothetical protein